MSEDITKGDAVEASRYQFYESLEQAIDEIPKRNITLVLGNFTAKNGRELTARPYIGQQNLHQTFKDNGRV